MAYLGRKPTDAPLTSSDIPDNSITAAKILDGVIDHQDISTNAVTTAKIAGDAVDGTKIADNAIDSEHYTDGSIDTAHMANGAITAAKIDSGVELGGPSLGASSVIRTNAQTISENITIPSTSNGMTAGPITIADGYTVTINGNWSII
jgi:hypothetical protein|tara:strand:- start:165 stop:608 length:444 start_codon:yes stop_codon:yes gene_type:complete